MSDDWAERMAGRIKKAREDHRRDTESELQRNAKIVDKAPRLWEQLVEAIQLRATRVNSLLQDEPREQLGLKINPNQVEVVITRGQPVKSELVLKFTRQPPAIVCTTTTELLQSGMSNNRTRRFEFNIYEGNVHLQEENIAAPVKIEKAAESLLETILKD